MNDENININLLSLSYSRYVSRAHTIFQSWIELMVGGLIGFFGLIFSYIQVFQVKPDNFKLIIFMLLIVNIVLIISGIAWFVMYKSRIERKIIVNKIKQLKTT